VSVITPGVPLYHDLFGLLHQRLCEHAEPRAEIASVSQLVRGPTIALVGGILVCVLIVSAWLANESGSAPPAGGRYSGILSAASWLVSQIGGVGVVLLCSGALLAPVTWLLVRVARRQSKRVIEIGLQPAEPIRCPDNQERAPRNSEKA
jgi:hypothetical protein